MLLLARAQAANLNSARAETWRGKIALRRGQGVTAEDGEIVLASAGPMVIYYRRATHGFARSARRSFEFGSPLARSREGARGVASGGLTTLLAETGHRVVDHGDRPVARWRPHSHQQRRPTTWIGRLKYCVIPEARS